MDVTIAANDVAAHNLTITNAVTTVTFETNVLVVDIISDGRAAVYYTINGGLPTIGGGNTFVLPAGAAAVDTRPALNDLGTLDTVRLIADGEATVSVQLGST